MVFALILVYLLVLFFAAIIVIGGIVGAVMGAVQWYCQDAPSPKSRPKSSRGDDRVRGIGSFLLSIAAGGVFGAILSAGLGVLAFYLWSLFL